MKLDIVRTVVAGAAGRFRLLLCRQYPRKLPQKSKRNKFEDLLRIFVVISVVMLLVNVGLMYVLIQTTQGSTGTRQHMLTTLHAAQSMSQAKTATQHPSRKQSLSRNESFGFFDISDDEWRLKKRIHAAQSRRQHSDKGTWPWGDVITDATSGGEYYQNNWQPSFTCNFEARMGAAGDGGKWVCDPHRIQDYKEGQCVVMSIGSNNEWSFEAAMHQLNPNCHISVFDPTARSDWSPPPFVKLFKAGLSSRHVPATAGFGELNTLVELARMAGIEGRTVDVLKIDCEGCEYDSLPSVLSMGARQVALEVHWPAWSTAKLPRHLQVSGEDSFKMNDRLFEAFHKHGYVIFHKEANTLSGCRGNCIEYSFIKLSPAFQRKGLQNLLGQHERESSRGLRKGAASHGQVGTVVSVKTRIKAVKGKGNGRSEVKDGASTRARAETEEREEEVHTDLMGGRDQEDQGARAGEDGSAGDKKPGQDNATWIGEGDRKERYFRLQSQVAATLARLGMRAQAVCFDFAPDGWRTSIAPPHADARDSAPASVAATALHDHSRLLWISSELPEIETKWISADVFTTSPHSSSTCSSKWPWKFAGETLAYLSWIEANYDALPDLVLFMHKHDYAWHRSSRASVLHRLLTALQTNSSYVSLGKYSSTYYRCEHRPGDLPMGWRRDGGFSGMPVDDKLNRQVCRWEHGDDTTLYGYSDVGASEVPSMSVPDEHTDTELEVQKVSMCWPGMYATSEGRLFEAEVLPLLKGQLPLADFFKQTQWRRRDTRDVCRNWNVFFGGRGIAGEFIVSRRSLRQYPRSLYQELIANFFQDCGVGKRGMSARTERPWNFLGERIWPLLWDHARNDPSQTAGRTWPIDH